MQFMLLIYVDEENAEPKPGTPEFDASMAGYMAFTKEVREAGIMVAGDAIQPTSTATCVAVRDGKSQITEGPFAKTQEQLGGYYLLECKDLSEAHAFAAKIPGASHGRVEVRPIIVYDN